MRLAAAGGAELAARRGYDEIGGAIGGFLVGALGAIAIDAAAFAWAPVRERTTGTSVTPVLSLTPKLATIGIAVAL